MSTSLVCRVDAGDESPMVYTKNWMALAGMSTAISSALAVLFWKRRRIQPIQARHPSFVMVTACASILWVDVLCFSRIFQHDFPCLLYLWSAYIGSIILLNMFMLRTFFLYADFNMTQFMIAARERYMQQLQQERKKTVEKFLKELDPGLSTSVSMLRMNDTYKLRNPNRNTPSELPPHQEEPPNASNGDDTNKQLSSLKADRNSANIVAGSSPSSYSRSHELSKNDANANDYEGSPSVKTRGIEQSTSNASVRTGERERPKADSTGRIKVKHGNGRKMSISMKRSRSRGDSGASASGDEASRSRSIAAGMTLYVDVDVKRLNKTLWRRVHQYLLRESPIKYLLMLSCLLLLAPAIDTGSSPTLRCWIGDQCLRQWQGTAAVLAVFAGLHAIGFAVIALLIRKMLSTVGPIGSFCLMPCYILDCILDRVVRRRFRGDRPADTQSARHLRHPQRALGRRLRRHFLLAAVVQYILNNINSKGLYAVGFVVIGLRIRKVRDTYGIRNELSGVGFVGIFCLPPWYILNNINSKGVEDFNDETSFSTLILVFMICVTILLSLAVPLYNSYETIPYIKKSSKVVAELPDVEELQNCEACLRNEMARKVFEQHLVDSFAIQHLHCWLDLQLFKNMVTRAKSGDAPKGALLEFQNEMQRLYLYYIKKESPEQINIGANLRRQLEETTEKIKSDAFLKDDTFMAETKGLDGDAKEFAKLSIAARKMHNAYQARWRTAEFQVFKLLRDQYKFFRRTKRFETFITELDADQKARLFARGAHGGGMLQGSDIQLETIHISPSAHTLQRNKGSVDNTADGSVRRNSGSVHSPLVNSMEPSISVSRQSFDV